MALHPQALASLEAQPSGPRNFEPGFDIEATRTQARDVAAAEARPEVAEVRDLDADGVPVRLYRPRGRGHDAPGVVVHLHGGGFVFGDVEVHDAAARRLALASTVPVLSVDYRRPPEHRFPAAPDDVDTVLRVLSRDAAELGLEGPVTLHGDSAGGNLALVGTLRNPALVAGLVLVYPFLDPAAAWPSYASETAGFDAREAAWFWQQYAGSPEDLEHPDLAPLRSSRLGDLPPTLVVTAEHDPLRDEGEWLAARLAELGVRVQALRVLGMLHGFWRHPAVFDAASLVTGVSAGFLKSLHL
ncbi:alpha/beta hydrolase [Nocardioidaceae bacterium]|nr:alpha/beta hydrolase [Nocardioidaceae bacterium]